jgi:hypothetical protein
MAVEWAVKRVEKLNEWQEKEVKRAARTPGMCRHDVLKRVVFPRCIS